MDIKAYIESGILEQYVLGMTSPAERKQVEGYVKEYPELKIELDLIEKTLADYAQAHAIDPPAGLKSKIMDSLPDKKPPVASQPAPQAEAAEPPKKSNVGLWAALAACLLLAGLAYNFFSGKNQITKEKKELQDQYDQLQEDCNKKTEQQEAVKQQIAVMRDTKSKAVQMKGTPLSPDSYATVYWNNELKKSYLDVAALPAAAPGKQYQLWAIVDGKPVDMGVFDIPVERDTFKEVSFIEKPQAFAVTLEPAGGVASPTMEQMYVIGEI